MLLVQEEQVRQKVVQVGAQFAAWQTANPNWTGAEFRSRLAQATGIKLMWVAAGGFTMGVKSDGPAHQVSISRPFFLRTTELTQAQWTGVMGNNPSKFKGDTLPVENVSYGDALAFCNKLPEGECAAGQLPVGWVFTLPTEAQWEYACRAGTTGDHAGEIDAMAWYHENSDRKTPTVGTKKANAWGLFDMHSNVWEWCLDWHRRDPSDATTDPTGSASGFLRVIRGGSWTSNAESCRSTFRVGDEPGHRNDNLGFRLALSFSP